MADRQVPAAQPADKLPPMVTEMYHGLLQRQRNEELEVRRKLFEKHAQEQQKFWEKHYSFSLQKTALNQPTASTSHPSLPANQPASSVLGTKSMHQQTSSHPSCATATATVPGQNTASQVNQHRRLIPKPPGGPSTLPPVGVGSSLRTAKARVQHRPALEPQSKPASKKREVEVIYVPSSSDEDDISLAQLKRKGKTASKASSHDKCHPPNPIAATSVIGERSKTTILPQTLSHSPIPLSAKPSSQSSIPIAMNGPHSMAAQAHQVFGPKHTSAFEGRPHIPTHGLPLSPISLQSNRPSIPLHLRMATTSLPQREQAFSPEVKKRFIKGIFKVPNRALQQAYVIDVDKSDNEIPLPTSRQEHRVDNGLQSSSHRPVEQASGEPSISSQIREPLLPKKPAVSVRKRRISYVSDSDNGESDFQPSSDDDLPLAMRPQKHARKKSKAQNLPSAPKSAVRKIEKNQLKPDVGP